jgi:hypothetical protein
MKCCGSSATHRFRLWASHFPLRRQKQATKEKATPTIGPAFAKALPSLQCSEKSGAKKRLASLRQFFVLIALILRFSGPINGELSSR